KHSSPSFGSYQICSYSNLSQKIMVGRCCGKKTYPPPWHLILTFIKPMSFCTRKLAYVIDSLVRVSRRVSKSRCGRTSFSSGQLIVLTEGSRQAVGFLQTDSYK